MRFRLSQMCTGLAPSVQLNLHPISKEGTIMSPELELFVQEEVASGRFPDREAFLSYCVRLLKLDRDDAVKGIQLGLDEADAGLGIPVKEAFAQIRGELK